MVEFAKRIPGFGLLAQDDQVTLLKAGVFEVLLVRLACMFDSEVSVVVRTTDAIEYGLVLRASSGICSARLVVDV